MVHLAAVGIGAGRDAPVLERTGKWVVNYDRDACHLAGQFGTGKDQVIIRLTRYEPGDSFDFGLYGRRFKSTLAEGDSKFDFGLGRPVSEHGSFGSAGKLPAMFFSSVRLDGWEGKSATDVSPKVTPAQEAEVNGITVEIKRGSRFKLNLGSLGKPLVLMRNCTDNLVKSWGYDPVEQANLLRPVSPITAPGSWFRSDDYPMGSVRMGHNGFVQFRLDIDAAGQIAGCSILMRTSPDDFADATCAGLKRRAKLQPALDPQGRPVRSFYINKVRWTLGS